jgi:hypothetical protein
MTGRTIVDAIRGAVPAAITELTLREYSIGQALVGLSPHALFNAQSAAEIAAHAEQIADAVIARLARKV